MKVLVRSTETDNASSVLPRFTRELTRASDTCSMTSVSAWPSRRIAHHTEESVRILEWLMRTLMSRAQGRQTHAHSFSGTASALQLRALPNVGISPKDAVVIDARGLAQPVIDAVHALRSYVPALPIEIRAADHVDAHAVATVAVVSDSDEAYLAAEDALERFDDEYWLSLPSEVRGKVSVFVA